MAEQFDYSKFPIGNYLDEICNSLKNSPTHCLVLTAETGAGKSTVLPLALLENFNGKMLMCEPRRLAVLGVANRLAEELNEECGKTIGYKIHLENKTSSSTRFEIVTEGILVRNLQNDPALEKYNVVVIDEFHERSVNTDLALAFLTEALQLRDDLFVIIMSATIETGKLSAYLGEGTPVLKVPGRLFEVETLYDDKNSVDEAILKEIQNKNEKGNILVFLPGINDIRKCNELIKDYVDEDEFEIHILHSSISLDQQKKAIRTNVNGKRKIILSSAIAETSLTVPGVTVVIDSGMARVNRISLSTGMENLVTEVESEFSAIQRKGRAGREQKGRCIRLWNEFNPRKTEFEPEILRADLSELVLECSERGIYDYENIVWLDSPSKAAISTSKDLLNLLGLIKTDGRITEKGKIALKLGLSPRLASIVIDGRVNNLDYSQLLLKYSNYSGSSKEIQHKFLEDIAFRISKISIEDIRNECNCIESNELLILSGFPDRIAKRTDVGNSENKEYQFYSGRKAVLCNDKHKESLWICAPEVLAGSSTGKIFDYETISENAINSWISFDNNRIIVIEKAYFENGKLKKEENACYGKIVLSSKKINPSENDYKFALINEVQEKGFDALPVNEKIEKFLMRVKFWKQQNNSFVDSKVFENELVQTCNEWLSSFITGKTISSENVYDALYWYCDGKEVDEKIPEIIKLTNGSKVKVKYEFQNSPDDKTKLIIRPVIEVIIQRMFGCFKTPEIGGMKVLLKLLSPASRPLQITDDLEGFWNGAWIEICKEMKGRYPKHNWDYKRFEE